MPKYIRESVAAAALLLTVTALPPVAARAGQATVTPQELARLWDAEHVSPALPPLLDHDEVERRLAALDPARFHVERIGESVQGRSISMVTVGSGPFRVLLWSQMHGDEPTATAALFDVFEYLERHAGETAVDELLSSLTIYAIPMLNPDGAEVFQRRNAQGIDINRDALRLQTPEGRALKAVRDRLKPRIGFNLHNENWRTSAGDPPKPASISLLAVAFDKARTASPGRTLAKKICAVIRDALEPYASGQIARYDDAFEVRAFGDNITRWGTPVVLIESGPYPSAQPDPPLVRLNFIAIVSALDAMADGSVEQADPKRYETLPFNESKEMYVLVKNATVRAGTGVAPFTADVGIDATRHVRNVNGQRRLELQARIADLGDLRTFGALRTIDATGLVLAPQYDASLKAGDEIQLPDWSKTPADHVIAVGQPAAMMLLRPEPSGRYTVDLILRY